MKDKREDGVLCCCECIHSSIGNNRFLWPASKTKRLNPLLGVCYYINPLLGVCYYVQPETPHLLDRSRKIIKMERLLLLPLKYKGHANGHAWIPPPLFLKNSSTQHTRSSTRRRAGGLPCGRVRLRPAGACVASPRSSPTRAGQAQVGRVCGGLLKYTTQAAFFWLLSLLYPRERTSLLDFGAAEASQPATSRSGFYRIDPIQSIDRSAAHHAQPTALINFQSKAAPESHLNQTSKPLALFCSLLLPLSLANDDEPIFNKLAAMPPFVPKTDPAEGAPRGISGRRGLDDR